MPRYVCDFDVVRQQAEKITTAASEMDSSLKTYVSNVTQHLEGWGEGSAKKAFNTTDEEQVSITDTHIKEIEEVGNFIKEACDKIENLENELGGMKI